ncbi:MAG TPA: ABC transporter permease [Terriglobia bacterium]|jgi:putative ABC transport system permease protein|nr:ABC transporter permease [Terriglobia bacterium]
MVKSSHVRENLWLALDTLRTHKFRSFLTVLGVLMGTTTVILVASLIQGLNQQMADVAEGFGTRTMFIYKLPPFTFNPTREERLRKPITYDDAMALKAECPDLEDVGVTIFNWQPPAPPFVTLKYKGQEIVDAQFFGNTANNFNITNADLADGRLFNEVDDMHRRDVVVLGAEVASRFFVNEDPIGKTIVVDGHNFTVVGTLARRKEFLGDTTTDRRVFVPYYTYKKYYPNVKDNFVNALAVPGRMDQALEEVKATLRRRRHVKPADPDSFAVSTADSVVQQFNQIISTVALVMIVLSSIGLLVGGIGVMNIMLVSVTERTREIGVRKAIGARRSDITWQFLLEAMTLTGAGGVMGISIGWFFSFIIRSIFPSMPTTVPLWSIITGFVVAVSVGLFFGMWPAVKASRLDPIVALRYE